MLLVKKVLKGERRGYGRFSLPRGVLGARAALFAETSADGSPDASAGDTVVARGGSAKKSTRTNRKRKNTTALIDFDDAIEAGISEGELENVEGESDNKRQRKMQNEFNTDETLSLIELIKSQPVLHDYACDDYKYNIKKHAAWQSIIFLFIQTFIKSKIIPTIIIYNIDCR